MVVGALIFTLGMDLMREALVDPWGKVHRLEYLTVRLTLETSILLRLTVADPNNCGHHGRIRFRGGDPRRYYSRLRQLRSADIAGIRH